MNHWCSLFPCSPVPLFPSSPLPHFPFSPFYSALNTCRAALRKRAHLFDRRHGGVPGKGRQQRAMGPTQLERFFSSFTGEQTIDEAGGETIPTADAIKHLQVDRRRNKSLAIDPCYRGPAMPVRGVHFAQRS